MLLSRYLGVPFGVRFRSANFVCVKLLLNWESMKFLLALAVFVFFLGNPSEVHASVSKINLIL